MADLLDDLNDLDDLGDDVEEVEQDRYAASSSSSSAAAAPRVGEKRSAAAAGLGGASNESANGSDDSDDEEGDDAAADGPGDAEEDAEEREAAIAAARAATSKQKMELDNDAELDAQLATLKDRTGYRTVSKLRETKKFQDHLAKVKAALASSASSSSGSSFSAAPTSGRMEDTPEYRLVVASNQLIAACDEEMAALYRYVADLYSRKFPELESIVPNPSDYIKTVKTIGNEMDMTLVDLNAILPSATVMVVTVTGSTTTGKALSPSEIDDVIKGCDEILALEQDKSTILQFIESKMASVAPNVSALVGTRIAALLIAISGGLVALSKVPGDTVMLLGQKRKALSGLNRHSTLPHAGVVYECHLVAVEAPKHLKRRAAKTVGSKVALMARVDAYGGASDGAQGRKMYEEIKQKIEKWQEPPPGKQKKPLPAPDEKPSKRRGGRQRRAAKMRLGLTEVRKEANRMSFVTTGTEYGDGAMGLDQGMLSNASGSGKLRIEKREVNTTHLLGAKNKKRLEARFAGSSGATGGFASSLVFTPSQGIELANPLKQALLGNGTAAGGAGAGGGAASNYFDNSGTFSQLGGGARR
jgi:U4/U6 small nuclear ribonucleoprotein PRP31